MRGWALLATLLIATPLSAQEIEPRAYANSPRGVNFLILGMTYSSGDLIFDPAVPITDAKLRTPASLIGYAYSFGLWGKNAKIDVVASYAWLSGTAKFRGEPVDREVDGFADPRVRLSVNFIGAPALPLKEFAAWKQDLIVGASLQVSVPVGQYDATRAVNLGTNRWAYKLETGLSKSVGPWSLEAAVAMAIYGTNDEFFGDAVREQDPLYAFQAHGIRFFRGGIWLALDLTYYTGARTTVDGVAGDDLQSNWRGGATFALPLNRRNSLKLFASSGVTARTGNKYDLYGVGWQYRWGGGV